MAKWAYVPGYEKYELGAIQMTDLEITKLCAEAMGIEGKEWKSDPPKLAVLGGEHGLRYFYDPLHDDAQAMALVKRFRIHLMASINNETDEDDWCAIYGSKQDLISSTDLNRAICECVAKMQASRSQSQS